MRALLAKILPEQIKVVLRDILFNQPKKRKVYKEILRLHSQFISAGDIVFDAGANTGDITKAFLKLGAKVVCVEANPGCVKILKKKFGKNKNVSIIKKGLSSKKGKLNFLICKENDELSTFSKKWKKGRYSFQNWNKEIIVPVTTLDNLIKKFGTPKFCKIDVEGYELQVLRGLKSKIPFISFEFHKEFLKDAKLCVTYLSRLGNAKFNFSIDKEFKLNSKQWLSSQELLNNLKTIPDKDLCGDIYIKTI